MDGVICICGGITVKIHEDDGKEILWCPRCGATRTDLVVRTSGSIAAGMRVGEWRSPKYTAGAYRNHWIAVVTSCGKCGFEQSVLQFDHRPAEEEIEAGCCATVEIHHLEGSV